MDWLTEMLIFYMMVLILTNKLSCCIWLCWCTFDFHCLMVPTKTMKICIQWLKINSQYLAKNPLCPIVYFQEIGYTHMRIAEGVNSLLQMAAMLARLCKKSGTPSALGWIYTVLHVSTKDSFLWMSEVQIFPFLMDKYCLWLRCLITL